MSRRIAPWRSALVLAQLHVFHGGHLGLVTEATQTAPVISRFLAAGAPAREAFPRGDSRRAAGSGQAG